MDLINDALKSSHENSKNVKIGEHKPEHKDEYMPEHKQEQRQEPKKLNDSGFIRWFSEIHKGDIKLVGGKAESLGDMFNAKLPVPPGFVVTTKAFDYFLEANDLKNRIKNLIEGIDLENIEELERKTKQIRELVIEQRMPDRLKQDILEAYNILSTKKVSSVGISNDALTILKNTYEPIFVSVRSSATAEDLGDASFAGQQESFLNVKGDSMLIDKVKRCFASLYTARAVYYRAKKGFEKSNVLLAAIVEKMIDSEKSGVLFSRDPVEFNDNIVIEAVFGLGEGIVSGQINPDGYIISRDLKIKDVKIRPKKIAIVRTGSGETEKIRLTDERSKSQVLTNGEILELANYGKKLEEHFHKPQDIEFAVENKVVYILQSRPITTLNIKQEKVHIQGNVILTGQGASPGIGAGIVKVVYSMEDLSKIKKGDILVTKMTNPDMVVSMQKASAIVTDEGGLTSHAAIVSREMGIPAVVGTNEATRVLKDGMHITVDGKAGKVYEGEVAKTSFAEVKPVIETGSRTKLKLILDLPEAAERAAKSGIDSIGLVRLEGIIASSGKHPMLFEKENKLDEYTKILEHGLSKISEHFVSIWIRSSDIRSDEYSSLKGAPEERELNPMLGNHGIRFSVKHVGIFEAELQAIRNLAIKFPDKKFGVMFPQIISVDEIRKAKQHFNKFRTRNMEFGIMVETPAACQIIEDICNEKIDFISFGTNDLTQFTLAIDRGNEDVQDIYNEMNPAVLGLIKRVLGVCRRYKVTTSICGQAGSNPEMIKFLLSKGISSISVNADAAYDASVLIKKITEERFGAQEPNQTFQGVERAEKPVVRTPENKAWQRHDFRKQEPEKREQRQEQKRDEHNEAVEEDKIDMGVYEPDEKSKDRYEDFHYNFEEKEDSDEFSKEF